MAFNTPILFLIFNRPESTARVFEKIREVKPKQLFVAADGPRLNKEGEKDLCEKTRNTVLKNIDWDCEVKTLFREQNLGCGKAVSSAITWYFENVEEGIILEDDCFPDTSFFKFCEELLHKYRDNTEVMTISGSNFAGKSNSKYSYFKGLGGIWGWASWRRAWALYDKNMEGWSIPKNQELVKNEIGSKEWFDFYYPMFTNCYENKIDTWDVQWFYSILINKGISINPKVNLVQNIGFGADSTHTSNADNIVAKLKSNSIDFPLVHPNNLTSDKKILKEFYFGMMPHKKKSLLKRVFSKLNNR